MQNEDNIVQENAKQQKTEHPIKAWWMQRSKFEKEFCSFVALPTLLTFGYFGLWASPMYISETQFAVKDVVEQGVGLDIASQIFKTSSSSIQNARIVETYLKSPDLFETLNKDLKIVDHYSAKSRDIISRLSSDPSAWDKEVFWAKVSQPKIDVDSGVVTFTVRAYDPQMAQDITKATLKASEALVNEMNERSRKDAIKLASNEVKIAQERVSQAQKALEVFRDEHRELDPKATASGLQSLVFELEGERAKVKAQLAESRSYMQSNAPTVRGLENRLAALETQLKAEKARIAGATQEANTLNAWVSQFESLTIESEFAQKQLVSAMTALEQARAMALTKTQYIVPIQQPTLPDESRYPRTWIYTLCAFFGFFFLYGMVRLIVASIREHAGF